MEKIEKILKFLKVEKLENGDGSGYGSGYGYGDGDGYGDGYGSGFKLNKVKDYLVYYVDEIPTVFDHIRGNVAKGKMIDYDDFSLKDCYVVKNNYYFAHGETLEQALSDLQEKTYDNMNIEDKILEFRKVFNNKNKYKGDEFFNWHHILTGSCLAGRNNFVASGGYDLDKFYTVKEFIKICENSYGGEIIKKLKEYYC